ncbi:HAD domain-containing protein [Streptomyces sp. NBC_01604]|uniref:HAD domain-containing protein n=1 Tax=Streptomyces sp. NBC_01604 TaxID=2975894 RepID=UPI003864B2F9
MTLLFLDVDGTLIPFGAPRPYPVFEAPFGAPPAEAVAHPLLDRVDPALGPRLAGLGCDLVWATTWMEDANVCLSPWLGLPRLPLVDWPGEEDDGGGPAGLHWKTRPLVDWAGNRPFVWLDDEITDVDRAWTAAHHSAPALLHRVDHRHGLTDADFAAVAEWLRLRLSGAPAVP